MRFIQQIWDDVMLRTCARARGLYLAHIVDLFSQEVSRVIYNYGVLILSLLILCAVGSLLRTLKGKLEVPASSFTFNHQETDTHLHSPMGKKNLQWHGNIIVHCFRVKGISKLFVLKFTFTPVSTLDAGKETMLSFYIQIFLNYSKHLLFADLTERIVLFKRKPTKLFWLTSLESAEAFLTASKNGVSHVYLKLPLFFSYDALYSLC